MGVALRTMTKADRERVLSWRNSPQVAAFMYTDQLIAKEDHARWFEAALADPRRVYWIIELDGQSVGLVNLYDIENTHGRCSWAYYVADPATRGKGVGALVEYAVLQHVFEHRSLNKLWCEVLADNEAVWKLHESFGFVREALFRQHILKGDEYRDVIGLGLLAQDWRRIRPDCEARLRAKGLPLPSADF